MVLSAAPARFRLLHVAVDDHSRYAYVEALPDERGPTAAAFLVRALAHFERQGIAVERILTDNGACYVSRIFTDTAAARNIRVKRTRPFRPQTNGKAEAFNKIMQAEWAYQRPYYSNDERLNVLPGFLEYYNHRRPHGGIGGATPASRLSTTSLGTTSSRVEQKSMSRSGMLSVCSSICWCCSQACTSLNRCFDFGTLTKASASGEKLPAAYHPGRSRPDRVSETMTACSGRSSKLFTHVTSMYPGNR